MLSSYRVFQEPPADFSPKMHAAGCYLVSDKRILILKRHPEKFQGATWGVPGGKLEPGEEPAQAVMREVEEEVGICISQKDLNYLGKLFIRLKELDYIFEIFSCNFASLPQVTLEIKEHTDFGWFLPEEARKLSLIQGGLDALALYEKHTCGV